MNPKILISRTDSIGDVVLTLPMVGLLKKHLPNSKVIFLGRSYTQPVVSLCRHVDDFENFDLLEQKSLSQQIQHLQTLEVDVFIHVFPNKSLAKLAKSAGIKRRIGTFGRWFHLFEVNEKVRFSRKKSDLHEAQLNIKLLGPLGIPTEIGQNELPALYGLNTLPPLPEKFEKLLSKTKVNLILHPKSKGSAVEWGLDNFSRLLHLLPADQFQVFITGTSDERKLMGDDLPFELEHVCDLTGKMTLTELIAFISRVDALVAASTGPLHLAAMMGTRALGLYADLRPIHPGRWAPLGKYVEALVCEAPPKNSNPIDHIQGISPEFVIKRLRNLLSKP